MTRKGHRRIAHRQRSQRRQFAAAGWARAASGAVEMTWDEGNAPCPPAKAEPAEQAAA